jgi:CRP-like cAMP-binding protein
MSAEVTRPGIFTRTPYSSVMTSVTLSDIAKVTAQDFARRAGSSLSPSLAAELAAAIELALLSAVRAERRACAAECERRGELWERTCERADAHARARQEGQFRANEARYLADVIGTRS